MHQNSADDLQGQPYRGADMITSRELTHALQEVYDPQPPIETEPDELSEAKHEAEDAALIVVGLVAAIAFVCVVGHIIAQAAP